MTKLWEKGTEFDKKIENFTVDLGVTHCFSCNDALSALDEEWDICNVCWINRRVKENEKIYKK